MLLHVVHVDVKILRCAAERFRIRKIGPGAAQHDDGIAELERGVAHAAIGCLVQIAHAPKAEGLGQPSHGGPGVPVKEIRCDGHGMCTPRESMNVLEGPWRAPGPVPARGRAIRLFASS